MQTAGDTNQRIRDLVAKIETVQDWKEFTALVEELNGLLDQPEKKPPEPST
ncbi:MAG: hypothetical protein WBQ03_25560 [Candidatus Sulfotelmatobacter sp.]